MLRVLKWIGSVLCALIAAAWVVSAGHAISWQSAGHELSLHETSIGIGWRPEGYDPAKDKYRGPGGFGVAEYGGGGMRTEWLPTRSRLQTWEGVSIPLWMVFVLVAVPTGWLWWKGRKKTRESIASFLRKLAPNRKVKLRIRLIWLFVFIHLITVVAISVPIERSLVFLFPYSNVLFATRRVLTFLLIATPVFGIFWAWLWVRVRNQLFSRFNKGTGCSKCGDDLSGNVSGICSECGTPMDTTRAQTI